MNVRVLVLLALSLASFLPVRAQTVVTGLVRNKLSKEPLPGAYVQGFSSSKLKAYAFSDAEGRFTIKVPAGTMLNELRVSLMGYAPAALPLETGQDKLTIDMQEQRAELRAAKVTASAVEERGDTLSFSAGAFRDGTERSVGELLEKLPGITVSASGGIQHEGTPIGKLYVEGLDLMGARYGVVTKNLSADAIARIDVYRNHQPVRALQDVSPSDRSAVNIILKESVRSTWMFSGDVALGLPPFPVFESRAMLSNFSRKRQSLFLVKGNNAGDDILQELQLQALGRSSGVIVITPGELDADLRSRLNPGRNYLNLPKEYWYDNLSGLGSFNHLAKTSEYTQLRMAAQAAGERYGEAAESRDEIRFADGGALEITETRSMIDRRTLFAGALALESNAPRRYLSNELSVTGQLRDNASSLLGNRDNYEQHYDLPAFKAENKFKATVRQPGKRALEWTGDTKYVRKRHRARYATGGRNYAQHFFAQDFMADLQLTQNWSYGRHRFGLSANGALEYTGREAETEGVRYADIPTSGTLSALALRPGVRLSDVVSLGNARISLALPATLHFLSVNGNRHLVYPTLNPTASLHWKFSQQLELTAASTYSLRRSDTETLLDAAVMQNWRTLASSDSLRRSTRWNNQATLRWNQISSMLFVSLSASWFISGTDRSAANIWLEDLTYRYTLPLAAATAGWSVNASVKKYFGIKAFVVDLSGGWSENQIQEYLQGTAVAYDDARLFARLSLESHPVTWFSTRLSAQYDRNFLQGSSAQQSSTRQIEGSLRVKPVRTLAIDAASHWLQSEIPGITVSNTPLFKLTLSWETRRGTIFAECRNLLDAREYRRESVSAYRTTASMVTLRGRQFLFGIRMSGSAK